MDKKNTEISEFLGGKLLIAMPSMGDARFEKSVIFMCDHSTDGAMGIIVNKPASDLKFKDLLEQLEIPTSSTTEKLNVHFGGPVEHGRGFVLHSAEYEIEESTLRIGDKFRMTATQDILRDLADGVGPEVSILALGYAGWAPGQLEQELQANGWLICEADPSLVFAKSDEDKWAQALSTLGIDPRLLSAEGGNA